jgi:Zn-finger nucleic acid-binding protein
MTEVALTDQSAVRVDVCRICHFVWFDACEVETLTPRPLPDAPVPIPQAEKEKLAIARVRQMAAEAPLREAGQSSAEWWKAIGDFLSTIIHG